MNDLSRGTIAIVLAALLVVLATGAALAQDSSIVEQPQPQVARDVVASWDAAHPLEFYLALPVSDYVTLAQTPNWANAHPLEYYLALPVGPQGAQDQNNVAVEVETPCTNC